MKKFLILVLAAILLAPGCQPKKPRGGSGAPDPPFQGTAPQEAYVFSGEPGVYGGAMVLAEPDDLTSFNPIRISDQHSSDVVWVNLYRCPIDYRNGDEPPDFDPGLCTKWESSPDAKQWTFYLRKGVRWSDGEPFDADDVIFTYQVILDPNVDSASRDRFIEGKDENANPIYPDVQKLDDYTVQFNLHKPSSGFLVAMQNLWLVPKHKWEAVWRAGNFRDALRL